MVKKGQLLFLIQQNTYQDQLQQAEAANSATKSQSRSRRHRSRPLHQAGETKSRGPNRPGQLAVPTGLLPGRGSGGPGRRDLAKLNLSYTQVTAPFDGRIDRRLVDPGNLVGAGEFTPLAAVNQIDPIYVYFTINEADLLRAMGKTGLAPVEPQKIKMPLSLGLANEEGYPHQGYSRFCRHQRHPHHRHPATPRHLPESGSQDPAGPVRPGEGPIVGPEKTALLVPEAALGYDQQGSYVLVVDATNVVQRRSVKLGVKVGDRRVIDEGLTGDEWVITRGCCGPSPGGR